MRRFLLYILLFTTMSSYAQFEEHFTDGGFNVNPHWDTLGPYFKVVNQVLNLQGNTSGGKAAIVTLDTVGASAQWNLYVRLGFQPADSANVKIVLVSDNHELRGNFNGYFVKVGQNGTNDGLDFYRKEGSNEVLIKSMLATQFANGMDGNLKVVKNNLGKWVFYWKNFNQSDYLTVDSVQERTYQTSSYFGMLCTYTLATKDSFWFDDVYSFKLPLLTEDTIPPNVVRVALISNSQIDVYFNETVDSISARLSANYLLSPTIGNPVFIEIDAINKNLVHLHFATRLSSRTNYTLTTSYVKDSVGNIMLTQSVVPLTSPYFAGGNDVQVNEIMIKPPAASSLPNKQYVELKNKTSEIIRLNNWTINGHPFFDAYLQPDGFIIVCNKQDTSAFKLTGNTVGVNNWTALTNDGVIDLKSDDGTSIDSLQYSDNFYQDPAKQLGGWSMELNDVGYSGECPKDLFWAASVNANGGTPGIANKSGFASLEIHSTDNVLSANTIEVRFNNAPMEKAEVENIANYSFDNGINILSAVASDAYATRAEITLSRNLDSNIIYHFTVKEFGGCIGYEHLETDFEIALTSIPKSGEVILNEILFNPNSNDVQFVEIYNTTSDKLFKLKDIILTQADIVSGFDNVILKMDTLQGYLFQNNYAAFSKNKNTLSSQYPNTITANCTDVNLPSFDKDEDVVVLKGTDNAEIDRLHYNKDWHFYLLVAENKTQGISLERTDFNVATQNKRNWHSAAKETNATPGYKNTEELYELEGDVHIIPEVFSPDGDGNDDVATITYSFGDDGSMVNAYLYNADGRLANHLVKDVNIPKEGIFIWNGDDENGNKKDVGIYFLVFERRTAEGKKLVYKRKCVLATKLN